MVAPSNVYIVSFDYVEHAAGVSYLHMLTYPDTHIVAVDDQLPPKTCLLMHHQSLIRSFMTTNGGSWRISINKSKDKVTFGCHSVGSLDARMVRMGEVY